ncbi:MAG: T9SS type A sorting domain-containing protein [Bacteroidia bacterium]|nr:T9SS type A sorting domain-containing protein [Bacteroidia bacterium]
MSKLFTVSILAIFLFSSQALAQSQTNAMHFDGVDDYIQAPLASSLLVGSGGFSISCWMKPENTAPSFPNFDGIIGFRNESDFDFYILQLTATNTECRFRNSSGVQFDLNTSGLVVNDWNHYTFSYDGSMLRLFINGVQADSATANGTVNNLNVPFNMGLLQFQSTNFYYQGSLDEVALWSKGITAQEANCIYKNEIDTNSTGLVLYYKFDQGKPNANNTTITMVDDSKNNIDGFLNSFALNDTVSNFVDGIINFNSADTVICEGSTINFGSQTISAIGEYSEIFIDNEGCDSTVYLTVHPAVDTSAKQNGFTITATVIGGGYQWVDCDNGFAPIAGETNQSFTATVNGNFAVLITENGCTDTSSCFSITGLTIDENQLKSNIQLYPNPVTDKLIVEFNQDISNISISLVNALGQEVVEEFIPTQNNVELNLNELNAGIYFLHVCKLDETATFRILKE